MPPWKEGTSLSWASCAYMDHAIISWRVLFMQYTPWVFCLALPSEGRIIEARIAIIAITTRSSMRVKPPEHRRLDFEGIFRSELKCFIWFAISRPGNGLPYINIIA